MGNMSGGLFECHLDSLFLVRSCYFVRLMLASNFLLETDNLIRFCQLSSFLDYQKRRGNIRALEVYAKTKTMSKEEVTGLIVRKYPCIKDIPRIFELYI